MRRINQLGSYKKNTIKNQSGVSKALPAKMRPSSQKIPAVILLSQPHCPGVDRLQEYPIRLMQHQQPAQLGQQITEIILNSSTETLLHQIAQAVGAAFWVDCCLIMTTSDSTQIGYWQSEEVSAAVASQRQDKDNTAMPSQQQLLTIKQQLLSLMPASSEVLLIEDMEAIATNESWHLGLPMRAVMAIGISQGKINGVISLMKAQPHQWSEPEKEHALAVATPVAIAISQVLQTNAINSLQQQVNIFNQSQSLLKQLTLSSRSSLDLPQIFALAIAGTAQALQVERGLILTLKYSHPLFKTRSKNIPKAQVTVVAEWHSGNVSDVPVPSSLLNQSFWLSDNWLCQQAFRKFPQPLIIDAEHLEAIESPTDTALFNLNSPAVLIIPIENGGTLLGFLVLQDGSDIDASLPLTTRVWHSEELALGELVSAQISNAIIQSQTLRQVQSLVEERTAQLQRSLEVQAKLYEKTRQQVDQLRHVNQLKDEFVSTMNHELRTPLTSMNLAIRMLRQAAGLPPERQAKYLDILEQQCNQEINLVNDLLKLQELESHKAPLNLETIDLKPKIHNLVHSFTEKWAAKRLNITVDLPEAPLVLQTDVDSLERILQELLTNAGKYSDPDTTILLTATYSSNQLDKQIIFTLTNFGSGISPEDVTHIFDKFRRGQGITQQAIQGTGLGLALVKCLVQHLNGTIAVTSNPNSQSATWETCFTLTLPQFFDHTKP